MRELFITLSITLISLPLVAGAFNFPGPKWPMREVTYSLNTNLLMNADLRSAIDKAFDTWNGSGADFHFTQEAPSSRYPSLFDPVNPHPDGHHDIAGVSFRERFGSSSPSVWDTAETQVYWSDINGSPTIIDVDELINTDYPYSLGIMPDHYDVQAVQTHEVGHWIKLEHPVDCSFGEANPTMCPVAKGTIRSRTLTPDDLAGIYYIYGLPMRGNDPATGTPVSIAPLSSSIRSIASIGAVGTTTLKANTKARKPKAKKLPSVQTVVANDTSSSTKIATVTKIKEVKVRPLPPQ